MVFFWNDLGYFLVHRPFSIQGQLGLSMYHIGHHNVLKTLALVCLRFSVSLFRVLRQLSTHSLVNSFRCHGSVIVSQYDQYMDAGDLEF